MKPNPMHLVAAFLVATLPFFTIKATAEISPNNSSSDIAAVASGFYSFPFPIESILNNPAVIKKQLSRNSIQAIGRTQSGAEHFIIHFRKEQLHGEWQSFYNADQLCDSGRFEKGLPDGEWKTWYTNGQLKTVRHYSAEKFLYIKADIQRNHPRDQRFAITKYAAKNPAPHFRPHYESNAVANQYSSMLQKIQYNTSQDDGSYLAPFQSCLHHGLYINYDANGAVKDSGNYVNGLKHGLWKQRVNEDSMYAFGFYNHGVRQGQWKYYDGTGSLFYTEFYNLKGKKKEWHYFKK